MNNFAEALTSLRTFNRMVASHPELSRRLIRGEYDFLQWRQAKIFIAFRERFREKYVPSASARRRGLWSVRIRKILSGLVACLLTCWAMFVRGKKDIVIFSVDKISAGKDHDFRLDGLYRFLDAEKLSFTECFHTRLDATTLVQARSRRRSAVYREAFELIAKMCPSYVRCRREARRLASVLPCEEFEESERPFVRQLVEWLLSSLSASRLEISGYRAVLQRIQPRVILAIDDTRYYQELCAAARLEGIPVHAFQHGHFTKYHVGWLASGVNSGNDARPDVLYVWSLYWKKELTRLRTNFLENEIVIGGNPKGDAVMPAAKPYAPPSVGETIHLLVPFETDAPHEEIARALRRLIDSGFVKIWLKTRPDWDIGRQMRLYGLEGDTLRAEAVSDPAPVLERLHAVAGVFTSYLYDALALRKPVFILRSSLDGAEGMIVNGLVDAFDAEGSDPAVRLAGACQEAASKLEERVTAYMRGAGRLAETLRSILARSFPDHGAV